MAYRLGIKRTEQMIKCVRKSGEVGTWQHRSESMMVNLILGDGNWGDKGGGAVIDKVGSALEIQKRRVESDELELSVGIECLSSKFFGRSNSFASSVSQRLENLTTTMHASQVRQSVLNSIRIMF